MNTLYITKMQNDIILALMENNKLTEIFVENEDKKSLVGNIYKARVLSISEGLKAAFVDYGEKKKGFLPLQSKDGKVVFELGNEFDEIVSYEMRVKTGDEILVQIERDEIQYKGVRMTSYISIPGNFIVLVPNIRFVGISKKIKDKKYRNEIRNYIYSFLKQDVGVIVRTAAYEINKSKIKKEYNELLRLWQKLIKKTAQIETPALVYKESSIAIKTVRNLIKTDISKIITDSKSIYNDLKRFFSIVNPKMKKSIELYNYNIPLLSYYDIDKQLESLFNNHVYLKHGAYIIVEPTEALTAIDVNSGKMSRNIDNADLIVNINLMAAEEIARQLRLRNIGGLIVIDFIDMIDNYAKRRVVNELKKHLRKDRATTKVLNVSRFGLVEMTRKKIGPSIINYFTNECDVCKGKGTVPKPFYTVLKFIRWIKENGKHYKNDTLIIVASKDIVSEIKSNVMDYLIMIMKDWNFNIKIESDDNYTNGVIEIFSYKKTEKVANIK